MSQFLLFAFLAPGSVPGPAWWHHIRVASKLKCGHSRKK
jgi:hypothetical protein